MTSDTPPSPSVPPAPPAGPDARSLAAGIVRRALADGAFVSAALSAELDRYPQLSSRDRAFTTELAYGTLRAHPFLRAALAREAPRGLDGLDPHTLAHLLVAAYQLLLLPRVPARAAVHEAVESIKRSRTTKLGAFANGLLRSVARTADKKPPPDPSDVALESAPPWLLDALARTLGEQEAHAFITAGPTPPPIGLRVRRGDVDTWAETLRRELPGATVWRGRASAQALLVVGAGDPRRWPGVAACDLVVQEEGSQVVAASLGARPGERVLDACAGRGNKTLALADAVGLTGQVDAADLHSKKLERLRIQASEAGVILGQTFGVDWSVGVGDVPEGVYDRVLVDAPCSGLGTLRRRPEIALRREAFDLAQLTTLQRAIVRNAARAVREGGVLVYAVCSVLREEVEDVVAGLEGFTAPTIRRLLPQHEGTDGYALVQLARVKTTENPAA